MRPHVIVLHRWRSDYARYDRYLSHDDNAVTYLATELGAASVPTDAAEVVVLPSLDDERAVHTAAERLAGRHGVPIGVIALKEDDLLAAASLRGKWGCAGPTSVEAERFRDKYLMCKTVAGEGFKVPPFGLVEGADDVLRFGVEHGWPVVVKPCSAHSSKGVRRLSGPSDVDEIEWVAGGPMLAQVFNPHPLYYVDGIFRDGELGPWRASRYLNSCLDFRYGDFVGAVEEDDPAINAVIAAHAEGFLSALAKGPLVFHLELFVEGDECSFLEVAARAGGAEIPYLWREVHGYDLMHAVANIQLGQDPPDSAGADLDTVAGLLLVPTPARRPCRIVAAPSMVGRDPGPYAEVLPAVGDVVPLTESVFEHVGGRFRFRGGTGGEVERAIMATLSDYRVLGESVG